MKNMTPVILVLLMLTSFFAGMDIHELEEQVVIDETGARAGADASVVAITTPKESTCNIAGCRNTLQVGEEVTFSAFIKNVGDADITELSYSVTIYLTDSSQAVGGIAKDAAGNDLVWENVDAMCDDGTICDFDSTTNPLAAGAFLGGGKLTLQRSGADIVWTPTQGEYMVEIAVDSPIDADTSNDAELVYVIVEDWYDIEVDLTWLDGSGEEMDTSSLDASSLQSAQFKLTVTADGSENFNPREVNIRLETSGQVATATLGSDDIKGISYVTVGTTQTVETYANETDPNATQTGSRSVLSYQTAWEMSGELIPTGDANAQFEITAEVANYTLYGQYDECIESEEATEGNENVTTWANFCEVLQNNDDRPKTDYDELTGSKVTYDDIRISRMGIYQGYNSDCTGAASTFTQEGEDGDLNVGCSLLYADVEHRGSDPNKAYGWNVSYSIALDGTTLTTGTMNECTVGIDMPYVYSPLGGQAPTGAVCVQTTLEPGEYTFDMTLTMNSKGSTDTDPMPWSGGTDQRTSNNGATMVIDVINNLPVITSFELTTEGDIVVAQESPLVFAVEAFDVDDPSGEGLSFAYSYPGGEIGGCSGTQAEGATVCTSPVLPDFIGNSPVTVVVTDSHAGEVSQEIDMFVWNSAVATATSDAGIEVQYSLVYNGQSEYTITSFTDADTSSYDAVQLEGFTGTYAAVAAMDYTPSTTYTASDVLDQSISVIVAKDVEATSLWYIDGSGKWILLSDASTDVDATTEMFTYDVPDNSPVVPSGKMVLMGGELAQASIPDASVSGFSAEAQRGGAIAMTWDITGTLLNSDSIVVSICAAQADCDDAFEATVADEDRTYTYSGSQTTHGETYHLEVAVCNEQGCSTPGIASVVADKQVDGDVAATNLAVAAQDGQWVVSWEVSGDSSDVAMWHVCWSTEDFTIGEMPTPCPDAAMGADATTVSIDMPAVRTGQEYFFTAVPMDALGNMDAAASMNSIIDTRVSDNSNTNDGNGTIGDTGDDASSSVPTWTWGLIGGVVIVAFIAGAFILSRGDGEGGEGKDWDY
tara:strand:- start:5977 stop:9117 length:3141 start_codon:yes stop_codon:yes gene_type:complete